MQGGRACAALVLPAAQLPPVVVHNHYRGDERSENAIDLQHIFSCYSSQKNAIIIMFHSMEIRIGRGLELGCNHASNRGTSNLRAARHTGSPGCSRNISVTWRAPTLTRRYCRQHNSPHHLHHPTLLPHKNARPLTNQPAHPPAPDLSCCTTDHSVSSKVQGLRPCRGIGGAPQA